MGTMITRTKLLPSKLKQCFFLTTIELVYCFQTTVLIQLENWMLSLLCALQGSSQTLVMTSDPE